MENRKLLSDLAEAKAQLDEYMLLRDLRYCFWEKPRVTPAVPAPYSPAVPAAFKPAPFTPIVFEHYIPDIPAAPVAVTPIALKPFTPAPAVITPPLLKPFTPAPPIPLPSAPPQPAKMVAPENSVSLVYNSVHPQERWVFADDFEKVSTRLMGERRGNKVFVGDRRIIQLRDTYERGCKRKQPEAIHFSMQDLLAKNRDWVFVETGQPIPEDGELRRQGPKRFFVNNKPIMTRAGFRKKTFVFVDDGKALSPGQIGQLVYQEQTKSLMFFKRPVRCDSLYERCALLKKPRLETSTTALPADTRAAIPVIQLPVQPVSIFLQRGGPTLFPRQTARSSVAPSTRELRPGAGL